MISPREFAQGRKNAMWWRVESDDVGQQDQVHTSVVALIRHLKDRQKQRRSFDLLHARLYANLAKLGFGNNQFTQTTGIEDERISLNVVNNMIESVVSRICQSPPKVSFLTSGESYTLQNRASLLEQFVEGQQHRTKLNQRATMAFRNSCIYGTGAMKIMSRDDDIAWEVVPPWQLTVDDGECINGEPRNLYQSTYMDREYVIEWMGDGPDGELTSLLRETALNSDDEDGYGRDTTCDQIVVHEAWHLSPKKGTPGRHVICVNNATLVDEEWEWDFFPFVFIRWNPAPVGFFGMGLASQLIGIQSEVNKLLRQIQNAHQLCGWPRVYVQRGSKIMKSHLVNEIGAVIEYDTTPPSQAAPPVVPAEIYNHLRFLLDQAYQSVGVSQLAATSQKPTGVESGIALQTLQDVATVRFAAVENLWLEMFRDCAYLMVWMAEQIGKGSEDYSVTAVMGDQTKSIPWRDARMALDEFVIQMWPSNALPSTPAGRIDMFEKVAAMGQFDPIELLAGIRSPDIHAAISLKLAARRVVDKQIEHIATGGDLLLATPEPELDLAYAITRATQTYCKLRLVPDTPVRVLRNLDIYVTTAKSVLDGATEPVPPELSGEPPPPPPVEAMPPELPPGPDMPPIPPDGGPVPPDTPAPPGMPPPVPPTEPGMLPQ